MMARVPFFGQVTLVALAIGAAPAVAVQDPCVVSDDPTYGYTRENPVQIGGGAMTVSARERQYMDALRGPAGEAVRYRRLGSFVGPTRAPLDDYEITYDGLPEPLHLYLDAYRWEEPKVPRGLSCARAIGLRTPAPDPFGTAQVPTAPGAPPGFPAAGGPARMMEAEAFLTRLAYEYPTDRQIDRIPLDPARPELGVAVDRLRLRILAVRAAARGDGPPVTLDPPGLQGPRDGIVVIAYPLTCDGRTVRPREVVHVSAITRGETQAHHAGITGADIGRVMPGVEAPDGAVASMFRQGAFANGDVVRIRYEEPPCETPGAEVSVTMAVRPPGVTRQAHASTYSGPPAQVGAQAFLDFEGVPREVSVTDGPADLRAEAARLAAEWRFRPPLVNDVAAPSGGVSYRIRFGAVAPAPPPPGARGNPVITGPGVALRTVDAPNLTRETSACPVAEDPLYGGPRMPVQVGGGQAESGQRIREYLFRLRGPDGQGLDVRALGIGRVPDGRQFLLYDMTYRGLAQPRQILFDVDTSGALMAPNGFTCFAPLPTWGP